jgi:DNA excision repair protein ERCC-4
MTKETVEVIVDVREPGEVSAKVTDHPEVESFTLAELPAGDLEIDGVGFERKTMSDYTSSLLEGRLEEQVVKLNQRYEHAYILVEGDLVETNNPLSAVTSNIAPESLRGSMSSLTARHGVPVLCCSNLALLADMAVRLARKHVEENNGSFVSTGAVGSNEPTAKMMYGCIDGVGADTAETLYVEYPSMAKFMSNATVEDLRQLDGIGKKTAEKIMEGVL